MQQLTCCSRCIIGVIFIVIRAMFADAVFAKSAGVSAGGATVGAHAEYGAVYGDVGRSHGHSAIAAAFVSGPDDQQKHTNRP